MKGRYLSALSALALVVACQDQRVPTAPARNAPTGPSALISDGAHCSTPGVTCNPDFFFLPPMVSNPGGSSNYDPGMANAALAPSLSVEICELSGSPVDAGGSPVAVVCVATVKTFSAGTVQQQGSTSDGFYMALWHTKDSNLDVNKFYRIRVMVDGSSTPLGVADIDPVTNMKEFKNARTGEVIPLNDDSTLPIKFRVEKNGSPCVGNLLCKEQTVTNAGGTVQVFGNRGPSGGALAGAFFPPGWLPPGGPQSVLVAISHVNTGSTNPDGTQAIQCHQGLPLQQFDDCFKFTTFPKLGPNSTTFPGHQFQKFVTTAVCYVNYNNEDVRSEWVQLWASDNGANFRKLPEFSDAGILSVDNRYCFNPPIIGDNSTGFRGLASAGWRKLKGGLGQIFGVQTAYGVDLGLGGSTLDFSNISPALSTQIDTAGLFGEGLSWTAYAKITGITHHGGVSAGINGLPVTFTVAPANGNFGFDEEEQPIYQVTVPTSALCGEGCENGIASVNWNVASTPGPHTITATGPGCLKPVVPSDACLIGPITFTVVLPPPIP